MGKALDLMERAFESILNNGSLIYDEAFMMDSIFAEISETVDPFCKYLKYMWVEKGRYRVDGNQDDKVLPVDKLRAALFYPSHADIMQTDDLCSELGVVCAMAFLKEFRDTSKATHNYLSSIDGQFSLKVISDDMKKAGLGKDRRAIAPLNLILHLPSKQSKIMELFAWIAQRQPVRLG